MQRQITLAYRCADATLVVLTDEERINYSDDASTADLIEGAHDLAAELRLGRKTDHDELNWPNQRFRRLRRGFHCIFPFGWD